MFAPQYKEPYTTKDPISDDLNDYMGGMGQNIYQTQAPNLLQLMLMGGLSGMSGQSPLLKTVMPGLLGLMRGMGQPNMLAMSDTINPSPYSGTGNRYIDPDSGAVRYYHNDAEKQYRNRGGKGILLDKYLPQTRPMDPDEGFYRQHLDYKRMLEDMLRPGSPMSPDAFGPGGYV